MVGRGANYPLEICPARLVGTGSQRTFSTNGRGAQERATYEIVFEPNTPMIVNLLHPKCRGLQRIIDRPKRHTCRVADSRSAMACDTICLPVMQPISVCKKRVLVDDRPHDVYESMTPSDRDVRFEHRQITPDSGFAHEGAQLEVPTITINPRVPMLRYPVTKLSAVAYGIRQRDAPGDILPRFAVEHPRVKRPGYRESLSSKRTRENADGTLDRELDSLRDGNHVLDPAVRR